MEFIDLEDLEKDIIFWKAGSAFMVFTTLLQAHWKNYLLSGLNLATTIPFVFLAYKKINEKSKE